MDSRDFSWWALVILHCTLSPLRCRGIPGDLPRVTSRSQSRSLWRFGADYNPTATWLTRCLCSGETSSFLHCGSRHWSHRCKNRSVVTAVQLCKIGVDVAGSVGKIKVQPAKCMSSVLMRKDGSCLVGTSLNQILIFVGTQVDAALRFCQNAPSTCKP